MLLLWEEAGWRGRTGTGLEDQSSQETDKLGTGLGLSRLTRLPGMGAANTTNPVLLFTLLGRLANTIESEDLVLRARKMKSRSHLPPECSL